jgi:hypothetical protein
MSEEEKEVQTTNIANPFFENMNVPMCIVSSGSDRYIGGLIELDGGNCVMTLPLRYGEFFRPTQDGKAHVDMMMEKVYAYAGTIKEFGVNYDTIYFLHPDNKEDALLVDIYFERHQAIQKRDAGQIEIKESSRIILPGINDIVASNQGKVR